MNKQIPIPESAKQPFQDLRWMKFIIMLCLDGEEVSKSLLEVIYKVAENVESSFWKVVFCNSTLHNEMELSIDFKGEFIEIENLSEDDQSMMKNEEKENLH